MPFRGIPDSRDEMVLTYSESVTNLLRQLLPNRTGLTISEVELSPQYSTLRTFVLKRIENCLESDQFRRLYSEVMTSLMQQLCQIAEDVNSDAEYTKMRDRDEKSLSSTLILLRFMTDIIRAGWKLKKDLDNLISEIFSSNFYLPSSYAIYYNYELPIPMDLGVIKDVLDTILGLNSSQLFSKALECMRERPFSEKAGASFNSGHHFEYSSNQSKEIRTSQEKSSLDDYNNSTKSNLSAFSLSTDSSKEEYVNNYMLEINCCIEIVLTYVSASDPQSFYEYVYENLFSYPQKSEPISPYVIQKYSPLIKFIRFLGEEMINKYMSDMHYLLSHVSYNNWRLAILFFGAISMKDQFLSRPQDYITFLNDRSLTAESRLFDFISLMVEDSPNLSLVSTIRTWFVVLCTSDFYELDQRPNKLKVTFNPRLKFLAGLLKSLKSGNDLIAFDSLINFLFLGASLSEHSRSHPVYQFSIKHLDSIYRSLSQTHKRQQDSQANWYILDNLMINFYICALLLERQKYLKIFIHEHKECNDSLRKVRILIKVTKAISELEHGKESFDAIMEVFSVYFRSLGFYLTKILCLKLPNRGGIGSNISLKSDTTSSDAVQPSTSYSSSSLRSEGKHSIEVDPRDPHKITGDITNSILLEKFIDSLSIISADNETDDKFISKFIESPYKLPSSAAYQKTKIKLNLDLMLSDIFKMFTKRPELFLRDVDLMQTSTDDLNSKKSAAEICNFARAISIPMKYTWIQFFESLSSTLFDSARALLMKIVGENPSLYNRPKEIMVAFNFAIGNQVIDTLCNLCLPLSVSESKFKSGLLYMKSFFETRQSLLEDFKSTNLIKEPEFHKGCASTTYVFEELILMSLSRNDVQYFEIAKFIVKCFFDELDSGIHSPSCKADNLGETLRKLLSNDSAFTGFVSHHKRLRRILHESKPTKSLFQVWLMVYARWLDFLDNKRSISRDTTNFRILTGFLTSTAGCFLQEDFSSNFDIKKFANNYVTQFFKRAISLLTSSDLMIRSIIKDSLSLECHPGTFVLVCDELVNILKIYYDKKSTSKESVLYTEQMISTIIGMVSLKNDGSYILGSKLTDICSFLCKAILSHDDPVDSLKLKIVFCKLLSTLESDQESMGILGAFKARNYFAKITSDWLERATFVSSSPDTKPLDATRRIYSKDVFDSPVDPLNAQSTISAPENDNNILDPELSFLNAELVIEGSKCLSMQLRNLVLHIPEGVKDRDIRMSKDLAFAPYLSLFYRILQKYISKSPSDFGKSNYKVLITVDNILKCITNLLEFDFDIGMQFVLPLGLHENERLRSYFLNVFAEMLATRKLETVREEFPDDLLVRLSNLYYLCGRTAQVAPVTEHNLLSASLYSVFGYTKRLDKLFESLLRDEIHRISRSCDIFRSNSILTKLVSVLAKDSGLRYLKNTLENFTREMIDQNVVFEIEKETGSERDANLFMHWFERLMNLIFDSVSEAPRSFRYLCHEIYQQVKARYQDAALIAVGSFVFLRFFCPVIISPPSFFNVSIENPKVRRSFLQLAKVMQNMANGSLSTFKAPELAGKSAELNALNSKLFVFLENLSQYLYDGYPFSIIQEKPIPELRYLHRFFYNYFPEIKKEYFLRDPVSSIKDLHKRVQDFRKFDKIVMELGQPKALISLKTEPFVKNFDTTSSNNPFNDFMNKMASEYLELKVDYPLAHSAIFADGTPTIVMNLSYLKAVKNDVRYLVYKIFEQSCPVWEYKFYMVFDFTNSYILGDTVDKYYDLMTTLAPPQMLENCARLYYFNLPRLEYSAVLHAIGDFRAKHSHTRIIPVSQSDGLEAINSLCLSPATLSIMNDERISFNSVRVYDKLSKSFMSVILKIGRQWLQMYSKHAIPFHVNGASDTTFKPAEVYKLLELTSCEISEYSDEANEFTLNLVNGEQMILVSEEKQEILKYLYLATTRLPNEVDTDNYDIDNADVGPLHWFARLCNISFHGLLAHNEEVRTSAAVLFASLSEYFNSDFGISMKNVTSMALPANVSDFIVCTSRSLSERFAQNTYDFLSAFLDYFDKLDENNKSSAILYVSPWIENVCDSIYLTDRKGPDLTAVIVRRICRLSFDHRNQKSCLYELVWKKLFQSDRLSLVLLDELITFTIHNRRDDPEWDYMNSFVIPSVDVCGEVITRLVSCVKNTASSESNIALLSKLFEIKVLVKICASLFFNYYEFSQIFVADIFFLCALFIDNPLLDFGGDTQKLFINTVHSFLLKPGANDKEIEVVQKTLNYFSGQRAKMLFGVTRDSSISNYDLNQVYNRCTNFELSCNYILEFISVLGLSSDYLAWRARLSSLAVDVVFSKTTIFNSRALLLTGVLSKNGITDSLAARICRHSSKCIESVFVDQHIIFSYSLSCVLQGLKDNTTLGSSMIWPTMCHILVGYTSSYQATVSGFVAICKKLVKVDPSYLDPIFEYRQYLQPLIGQFEKESKIGITRGNFEYVITFAITKGLLYPHIKLQSLRHMTDYFAFLKGLESSPDYDQYRLSMMSLPVLFFIFLSMPPHEFEKFMIEASPETTWQMLDGGIKCPDIILEFIQSEARDSKLVLIHAAEFFGCKSISGNYKHRFLSFFNHLLKRHESLCYLLIPLIKAELQNTIINADSSDVVKICLHIIFTVMLTNDFSITQAEKSLQRLLQENSLQFIRNHRFVKSDIVKLMDHNTRSDFEQVVSRIRALIYRSACSHMESLLLED